jgi:creatinine amidohydrolase
MDLVTDVGEQGFKWGFILSLHGAPPHNRALDEAARYFSDTYGGHMVHLTGLVSVGRSAPRDLFSPAQVEAEGVSVHADADEHSRVLFLRPDIVSPDFQTARPVVGHGFEDLIALATQPDWPGYFGTPAIGTAAAGARVMNAIAQATIDAALKTLDGASDTTFTRMSSQDAEDPDVKKIVDVSLEHERLIEARESAWLARDHR